MKVLLITNVPPSTHFSGSLLTWHLCKNLNKDNLVGCFVAETMHFDVTPEYPFEGTPNQIWYKKRSEQSYRPFFIPRKLGFIFGYLRELFRKHVEVKNISRKIQTEILKNKIDRVWIILEGQTLIWLAEDLIKYSGVPVKIQVWDYPEWYMKQNRLERFSKKMLSKSFDFCLSHCDQYGAPSWEAQKKYKKNYQRDASVFVGINPYKNQSLPVTERTKIESKSKIIIGIVGQLYAVDAFGAMVHALDQENWKIDGRDVEIHFWGKFPVTVKKSSFIQRKYVSQQQLLVELADCDILYCPYWFGEIYRTEATTSFPSKLATYLMTGKPIVFHGPEYTSPAKFITEHNCAICCPAFEHPVVMLAFRTALYDELGMKVQRENAQKVISTYLSQEYLNKQFQDFIS